MQIFRPVAAATVNIDVSSSSQIVNLGCGSSADAIRMMNNGSATVWVNFGKPDATAAVASGFPVGPGMTEVMRASTSDGSPLHAAAIAAGSTGKIYFTYGDGI